MAICSYCNQEMTTADGCIAAAIVIDGNPYAPIRFGQERPRWRAPRCGDCNVLPGQVHHHGCDVEQCPACGEQSISCDCRWAGEEDEDDDWEEDDERVLEIQVLFESNRPLLSAEDHRFGLGSAPAGQLD